jgi:Trk K+ transport system NAD-binding subunit
MKTLSALITTYLRSGRLRGNIRALFRLIVLLLAMIAVYTVAFHFLMRYEGQDHSWVSGFYWVMVAMSTLGYGDITFESDLGRLFSVLVLTTGTIYLLILLPFSFIQFFYAPWLEARDAARAPRQLPADLAHHVLLTARGPVDAALIGRLHQFRTPYAVIVADVADALRLHDEGVFVMVGDLDDPDTYRRARADAAGLVVATQSDTVNTNIAVTVREVSPTVPIVATAASPASVDILELAGCRQVIQPGEMLGRFMARRVFAGDGRSHVIGEIDDLLIAEAWAAKTTLVGRSLRDLRLPDTLGVTVAGVWERGQFALGGPDTVISPQSIVLLGGTRDQLDQYDRTFGVDHAVLPAFVVIVGGGRVGQAAARALAERGVPYRIVERQPRSGHDDPNLVVGDAADLEVLRRAGIDRASCAIVTTHEDDMNVYLTLYCRRLQPDLLLLSRATLERNTRTLYRAGADFVLSYASLGASAIFNLLRDRNVVMLAEGLDVFTATVPDELAGKTLLETHLRQQTRCNLLAIRHDGRTLVNPDATTVMPPGAQLTLIGDRDAERLFLSKYTQEPG